MRPDLSEVHALAGRLGSAGAKVEAGAGPVVRQVAEQIASSARSIAPSLTGALRASITVEGSGTDLSIGPTVLYGRFVEYGTYKDSPQPFMSPAADAHRDKLPRGISVIAKQALR